jgi:4-amino-4-deoxy-L-arabinose transferase-like glycosyltransferase
MAVLTIKPSAQPVPGPQPVPAPARRTDLWLCLALIAVVLIVQGWNIAGYPTVSDDEGTYLAQAWAVQHGHGLAPYTYWYDHPPVGWIQLSALSWLPHALFHGHLAAAYARFVMLPVTAADVALLYVLARRLTGSRWAAVLAGALFALSPLSVTLQREVFLDNFAVCWILAAFVLATSPRAHLWHHTAAGLCTAVAVLSKETILIAVPGLAVVLWQSTHRDTRKFSAVGFSVALALAVVFYPLYALLKGELVPGAGHVSLLGGLAFQMSRAGSGFMFTPGTGSNLTLHAWLYYDPVLIVAGVVSALPALAVRRLRGPAIAALALAAMALRPGYLPAMYVIQALPFLALCAAGTAHRLALLILRRRPTEHRYERPARYTLLGLVTGLCIALVVPAWYSGDRTAATADPNAAYSAASTWMRTNLRPDPHDKIVLDDALWLDAVDTGFTPGTGAIWFYKVDLDPEVNAALTHGWKSLDYVVSTPTIRSDLSSLPTVAAALANSLVLAVFGSGGDRIEVRRVTGGVE